jgi:hypothetical protein
MPLTGAGKVFKPQLRWDAATRVSPISPLEEKGIELCAAWYCTFDTHRRMLLMAWGAHQSYLSNAVENTIWAACFFIVAIGLCRLLPEFNASGDVVLVVAIIGIAAYLLFLIAIDVPMYLTRSKNDRARSERLQPLGGVGRERPLGSGARHC